MKHISGCPPSLATRLEASIRASSIDWLEPSYRTPARRVGSADLSTFQKLSPGAGATSGNHALNPLTFKKLEVEVDPPTATSPCTER